MANPTGPFSLLFFWCGCGLYPFTAPYMKKGVRDMPYRSNTPCKHPGCAKLVPYGSKYCGDHEVLHRSDRDSSGKRGYNSKWQKARARYLVKHPLCVECSKKGVYVKATVVDHVADPQAFLRSRGIWRIHQCRSRTSILWRRGG